jgi:hypothetical protein
MPFNGEKNREIKDKPHQYEQYPGQDNSAAKKAAAEKLAKVAMQNTVKNKPKK